MSKTTPTNADPMGRAIAEFWRHGHAPRLRVFSPHFDEDEIPVEWLFRTFADMPALERRAIEFATGRTLDVGAGAGCHALELQSRGIDVTAIDISTLAVETMRERGVKQCQTIDFYDVTGKYDTILMLMNGIGIAGRVDELPRFFAHVKTLLAPGGQLLCDSSDLRRVFEDENGVFEPPYPDRYYGEMTYRMQCGDTRGNTFNWLYIDPDTLTRQAREYGLHTDILLREDNGDSESFLARLTCI